MLLQNKFRSLADSVFQAITGVTKKAKYHKFTGGAYQSSTGSVGSSVETYNVTVIVNDFRRSEIDGEQVLVEDKEILLPANQISSFSPSANDIVQFDQKLWQVVSVQTDAVEAVYTLQVRKKQYPFKFTMNNDEVLTRGQTLFAFKIENAVQKSRAALTQELFNRAVEKTPVNTGRARAAWTVSEDAPDSAVPPEGQDVYQPPIYTADESQAAYGITFVSNNVEYADELEFGSSDQNPSGMLRVSREEVILESKSILQRALSEQE